jgi:nucleoid DNA-binding protein/cell division septation protein DedD
MIIKNIIRALQTEESVYLSSLGIFRCVRKEASINDNKITPPQVIIQFQEDKEANGFAFATKLSQWEQITIVDAYEMCNRWIDELKAAINNNQSITYDNFGTFRRGKKEEIIFESSYIQELNLEFEGMNPLVITPTGIISEETTEVVEDQETPQAETTPPQVILEPEVLETLPTENDSNAPIEEKDRQEGEIAEVEAEPESAETMPLETSTTIETENQLENNDCQPEIEESKTEEVPESEDTQEIEEEEEEEDDDDDDDDDNKGKRKRRWEVWLFIFIILASIGVLAALFDDELVHLYQKIIDKKETNTELTTPSDTTDNEEISSLETTSNEELEEEVEEVIEPTTEETIVQEVKSNSNPTTTNGNIPIIDFESGKFYVIAGSFIKQSDAELHIKQKSLQRYNAKIVKQNGNNRLRVCIGIFDTENEAINFAAKIDKNYWVLK